MMEAYMNIMEPPHGPIRRRSKQRSSPGGIDDCSIRRPWTEPDRGQDGASSFQNTVDQGAFARNLGATGASNISHSTSDALSRGGLTSRVRIGYVPLRQEHFAGPAGSSHVQPAPQCSLPDPVEMRPAYELAHQTRHLTYAQPQSNGYSQPTNDQHSISHYSAHSQSHEYGQTSHEQHAHTPVSYHQSQQNNVQAWCGTSTPQHQPAPTATYYVHSSSSGRLSDSSYPRRLPMKTSPPPFTAPVLQAEISQLATAPPQNSQPHNPPVPRDLSHLIHPSSRSTPEDQSHEARPAQYSLASYDPVRADRYPVNHWSASFGGQPALSHTGHPRAEPAVSVPASSPGIGSDILGFTSSPVHPPMTAAQPPTATFHPPTTGSQQSAETPSPAAIYYSNAYTVPHDQGYADQSNHRPQLPSVNTALLPAVTRGPSSYQHSTYSSTSSSENYQSPPIYPQTHALRERGYPGQVQQSIGDGSEYWLMIPPAAASGEEESPPQHSADHHGYHNGQIPDTAVISLLGPNEIGGPWEETVDMTNREMELAARNATSKRRQPPLPPTATSLGRGVRKGDKKTRGKFTDEKRRETAQTRKNGACIRCKCQRVRCDPTDPNDPNAPCQSCLKVNQQSKKMIHACICRRYRLTEILLSRQGGLNMTTRWSGTLMKDVSDRVDDVVRVVELKIFYSHQPQGQDLYHYPIRLEVHRFNPMGGDVLHRKWRTRNNLPMVTEMTPFALNDINQSAAEMERFISDHAFEAMRVAVRDSHLIVRETYEMAIEYFRSLEPEEDERQFLGHLFKLWFAMRLTTGSAYISGSDKLDMRPTEHPDYPLGDKISLPRMITAQVDSILSTRFLKPGTAKITKFLETFLRSNNPKYWFSLYLAIFILLHEISVATKDRGRYARDNMLSTRFSLPSVVREQHFSANNLLAHWHYYKTEIDPSNVESWKLNKSSMGHMNQEQRNFIWRWWHWMRQPGILEELCPDGQREQEERWEEPLFFVCQLYMPGWKEKAVFQGY